MTCFVIVLICLLLCFKGMLCDNIPAPKMTRYYPSHGDMFEKCYIKCSASSVTQASLTLYNESTLYSSLIINDLNNKLDLEVNFQDTNNYSCVISSSGINATTFLNKTKTCQLCREENTTIMLVSEEDSVTLPTNLTEVHYEDDMQWFYKNNFIAELFENKTTYHDCDSCGFGSRLMMDRKTGSLTVTNISKIHSGVYKLLMGDERHEGCHTKTYNVSVYDSHPVPLISNDSTQCSDKSKCVVMCSVNKTDVTLSWYNGSRLNSSIIVSDLNISNFLCLEVEYKDNNTYTCVVNNFFTNKTTQLYINRLCKDQQNKKDLGLIGILCIPVLPFIAWLVYRWRKKKWPCQKVTWGDQNAVAYNVAQGNVAVEDGQNTSSHYDGSSRQGASDNNATENSHLLGQASS